MVKEGEIVVKRKIDQMSIDELANWYFSREMRKFHQKPAEVRIWRKHLIPIFEENIAELKKETELNNAEIVAKMDEMLDGLRAKQIQKISAELLQGELLKKR